MAWPKSVEIHPVDPRDTYTYTTAFLYVKDAHHVTINDVKDEELPNDLQVRIGDDNGVINSSPDR